MFIVVCSVLYRNKIMHSDCTPYSPVFSHENSLGYRSSPHLRLEDGHGDVVVRLCDAGLSAEDLLFHLKICYVHVFLGVGICLSSADDEEGCGLDAMLHRQLCSAINARGIRVHVEYVIDMLLEAVILQALLDLIALSARTAVWKQLLHHRDGAGGHSRLRLRSDLGWGHLDEQ